MKKASKWLFLTSGLVMGAMVSHGAMIATSGAGSALSSATNTATFDRVVNCTDLTNFAEDGLKITLPDTAFRFAAPRRGTDSFSGGFHYGSGGAYAFTLISTVPQSLIYGLEFNVASGWGNLSNALYWQTKVGGLITGSGVLTPELGSVVGFADRNGFQTLELGLYSSMANAECVNTLGRNRLNALALDNLRVTTLAPTGNFAAIPEPSTALFGLAMTGAVGFCRRRGAQKKA